MAGDSFLHLTMHVGTETAAPVPPVSGSWATACWMVKVPALCSSALTQTMQAQSSPNSGGQKVRQSTTAVGNVTMARRA